MEHALEQVEHPRPVAVGRARQVRIGDQRVQRGGDVVGVVQVPREVEVAVDVGHHQAAVPGRHQDGDERAGRRLEGRERVVREEARQDLVRVERVAVLVGAVQRARAQGSKHDDGLRRVEQAAREDRDLALEHRREPLDAGLAVGQREHVVRVEERVRAPVGPQARLDIALRQVEQVVDVVDVHRGPLAAEAVVDALAVGGAGRAEVVHGVPAVDVVEPDGQVPGMVGERGAHVRYQVPQLAGDLHVDRQQAAQPAQVPVEVRERHDREALADQRVVRVVPLGALGVHPDAAVGHEVDQLREQEQQQLLAEGDPDQPARGVVHEPPVPALGGDPPRDHGGVTGVVRNRLVGVVDDGVVGRDPVGHVGVRERRGVHERVQAARVEAVRGLEQLEHVDDLVVVPVPDVRPRVAGLRDLPVDARARDPVGVVAVRRGRVEEHGHHRLDVLRERPGERLPVLEDVAPVALELEQRIAGRVPQRDPELVPRAARIAVPAAERERQVLRREAHEVDVAVGHRDRDQLVGAQVGGQRGQDDGAAQRGRAAALGDERAHVGRGDRVAVGGQAAAHRVEQDVGQVVGGGELVPGLLGGVGRAEDRRQVGPGAREVRVELGGERPRLAQHRLQRDHLGGILVDVGRDAPALLLAGGQGEPSGDQVGPAFAADVRLGGELRPAHEGRHLPGREHHARVGEPDLPRDVRQEGLARLGEVGEPRVQPDRRQPGPVDRASLVGVEQVAELVLQLDRRARGEQVDETVEQVDGHRAHVRACGRRRRRELGRPHDTEPAADLPGHPQAQRQVGAGLLEHEGGAEHVLVQHPLGARVARPQLRERLPGHDGAVRSGHAEHAAPAGAAGGLGHLVVRVVREQRVTGVGAAGGEPPRARDEEPDVARADDRHEERRDLLVVGDPVEPASVEVDVRTGGVDHGKVLCISAVGALSQ